MLIRLDGDSGRSGADALARVKQWVEARVTLPDGAAVLVTELQCREEGCPPLETVIAVLTPTGRWHRTIHGAASTLTEENVAALLLDYPHAHRD